jgi:hypothetical protein
VKLKTRVKGDFEITSAFEILQAEQPTQGHGVGFSLLVEFDSPRGDVADLVRASRVVEGEVFICTHSFAEETGKKVYHMKFPPAAGRSGRLRLTRIGREVVYWAAEGAAGEFAEMCRHDDIGTDDVVAISANAFPGHAPNFVDLRILDLRVHVLDEVEARAREAAPPEQRNEGSRLWLAAGGLVGAMICLATLTVWYVAARSRRAGPAPSTAPAGREQTASAESAPVSFPCCVCGKGLRVRADLAGKQVRCPRCSQPNRVPPRGPAPSRP